MCIVKKKITGCFFHFRKELNLYKYVTDIRWDFDAPSEEIKGSILLEANQCNKQYCIPVGCVPPACCPYLPTCTAPGGGLRLGGGTYPWFGGVCLLLGVPASRPGGVYPSRQWGRAPLWTEWQTGAKILPCPKLHLRPVKIYFGHA